MDDYLLNSTLDNTFEEDPELIDCEGSHECSSKQGKFIVFKSALLPLFRYCRSCGQHTTLSTSLCGTLLVIKGNCPDDHTFYWQSQPLVGKAPAGNLLLAGAIHFSGLTYTKFATIVNLLNLKIFTERTFYRIQEVRLFPIVNSFYKETQIVITEILKDKDALNLSGDGRCNSPG